MVLAVDSVSLGLEWVAQVDVEDRVSELRETAALKEAETVKGLVRSGVYDRGETANRTRSWVLGLLRGKTVVRARFVGRKRDIKFELAHSK